MDAREILAATPLFADALDAGQLRTLATETRPAFFRAETRLMNQGDFGGSMFVIVEGEVAVSFADEGEREQRVATLGKGEVVGEMSLFSGDRRSATVTALTNVDAIEITKSSLEGIFRKAPDLIDRFGAILAKRQAELKAMTPGRGGKQGDALVRQARKVFAGFFRRPGDH